MYYLRRKLLEYFMYSITAFVIIKVIIVIGTYLDELTWKDNPMVIYWPQVDHNTNCYDAKTNDALQSVEDLKFSLESKSIFFHETSCRGGIDSRQACAVESAARANPDWEVYLLFNAPVSKAMLKKSCLVKLLQYPNVRVARIHASSFSANTVAHKIVTQDLWKSKHPVEHSADIMKMLTLNRWGGVYLDLDVLVKKSFNTLAKNWIAKETASQIASGVMRLSKDAIGQNITADVLREIASTYDTEGWSVNGALAIQRVLQRRCSDINKTISYCQGITIYDKELFYPIKFLGAPFLVKQGPLITGKEMPYTYHMWNLLTKLYTIHPDSVYVKIASQVCPTIYKMFGDAFGV